MQRRLLFLCALLVADLCIWQAVAVSARAGLLTVAFLDIGQGDAIFIEAPSGAQMLVDGGPDRGVLRELGALMPAYDRSIDIVLATHPDADHIGGLPDMLEAFEVSMIVTNGATSETATYRAFEQTIVQEVQDGAQYMYARRGTVIVLDESVRITILFPDRDTSAGSSNDGSIVARVDYGDTSVLLTGDAPSGVERYLVAHDPTSLDVDVLKVGHHGSRTSTSAEFLAATTPEYAVISAGKDNRYGHPHEEVLEKLKKARIETLRIDELGTIVFETDGKRLWRR